MLEIRNKEYHIKTEQYFTKAEKEIRTNELGDIESPWKLDKKLGNSRSRPSINSSSEELKNTLSKKREKEKRKEENYIEISDLHLADVRELLKKITRA